MIKSIVLNICLVLVIIIMIIVSYFNDRACLKLDKHSSLLLQRVIYSRLISAPLTLDTAERKRLLVILNEVEDNYPGE